MGGAEQTSWKLTGQLAWYGQQWRRDWESQTWCKAKTNTKDCPMITTHTLTHTTTPTYTHHTTPHPHTTHIHNTHTNMYTHHTLHTTHIEHTHAHTIPTPHTIHIHNTLQHVHASHTIHTCTHYTTQTPHTHTPRIHYTHQHTPPHTIHTTHTQNTHAHIPHRHTTYTLHISYTHIHTQRGKRKRIKNKNPRKSYHLWVQSTALLSPSPKSILDCHLLLTTSSVVEIAAASAIWSQSSSLCSSCQTKWYSRQTFFLLEFFKIIYTIYLSYYFSHPTPPIYFSSLYYFYQNPNKTPN